MTRAFAGVGLIFIAACGSDPKGRPVELTFGDAAVVASGGNGGETASSEAGGAGGSAVTGTGGAESTLDSGSSSTGAGGEVVIVPEPPTIDYFGPEQGPWGTRVTLRGSHLVSAGPDPAELRVGPDLVLTQDSNEIVSWTSSELVVRIPFPHEGEVMLQTPEGQAVAGSFTPSHAILGTHPVSAETEVLSSVSLAADGVTLALATDPISILGFDGSEWQEQELPDSGLRLDTLRLHGSEEGELRVVGLSDADPPEILAITPGDTAWTATGIFASDEHLSAGGPGGAAVWFRSSDGWERARPSDDVWQLDKGPVDDPFASSSHNTQGATSDGALWVVRSQDTGTFLDDKGAPFMRRLGPNDASFGSAFKVGNDLDDSITGITVFPRGRGLVVYYCGSDTTVIVGGEQVSCLTAVVLGDGSVIPSTIRETRTARHALGTETRHWVTCNSSAGSELSGEVWAWPCLDVAALEIDPIRAAVPVFRYESQLVVLRPR